MKTNNTVEEINISINNLLEEWNISDDHNDKIVTQIIGLQLKKIRLVNKLTQTRVAKAINVTFQQVQKYERGANAISEFKARRICTYLGKDYNLLQEENDVYASPRQDQQANT